jgi:hypothetical protein
VAPPARPAVLAAHAGLVPDPAGALDLPVGALAALAASVYAATFGAQVEAVASCPGCGELLDVPLPLAPFTADAERPVAEVDGGVTGLLAVRAPTSRDLLDARATADPVAVLLARCVTHADGAPCAPADLDATTRARVDAAADDLAGAAALVLRVECPGCGTVVRTPVDVGAMLWDRIAAAAPVALAEVAELAAAFGWPEADVLALSPARRQAYLALARGGPP